MPQIFACTDSFNPVGMLVNLIRSHPGVIGDDTIRDFNRVLNKLSLFGEEYGRVRDYLEGDVGGPPYQECFDDKAGEVDAGCSLVLLMDGVRGTIKHREGSLNTTVKAMHDFVAQLIEDGRGATEVDLKDFLEARFDVKLQESDRSSIASSFANSIRVPDIVRLYMVFFPIYTTDGEGGWILQPPKSLASWTLPGPDRSLSDEQELADVVGWLAHGVVDKPSLARKSRIFPGLIQDYAKALDDLIGMTWLSAMRRHLGVATNIEAIKLVNSLDYKYAEDAAETAHNKSESPCKKPGQDLEQVCGDTAGDSECTSYCNLMNGLSAEMVGKVTELLDMGMDELGLPWGVLPMCQYPANWTSANEWSSDKSHEGCWRKVVNDQGVCYTTSN